MSETETTTPAAPKKPTPTDQGVPAVYLNDKGDKFLTGMDARLKSDLILSALGLVTTEKPGDSKVVFTDTEALRILEARDWMRHFETKKALEATKSAKKAQAAADREARAREAAEAKAKKDAEKKAAADAKAAEDATTGAATGGKASSKTDQARAQREAKAAAGA